MNRPEQKIHIAIIDHLKIRGVPGLVYWHVPNGGLRTKREASLLKAMGVRPGVADLILVHDGKIFALELKAPGGRPTLEQINFCADMERQGAHTAMPSGLDAALSTLESWGLLSGRAQA